MSNCNITKQFRIQTEITILNGKHEDRSMMEIKEKVRATLHGSHKDIKTHGLIYLNYSVEAIFVHQIPI